MTRTRCALRTYHAGPHLWIQTTTTANALLGDCLCRPGDGCLEAPIVESGRLETARTRAARLDWSGRGWVNVRR